MEAIDTLQGEAVETNTTSDPNWTTRDELSIRPLPPTTVALIEQRKSKASFTLNDMIEKHHLSLYEQPDYQRLLEAVYSEQAVEGSLVADDLEAARMIRKFAKEQGDGYVAKQKLATIVKSMAVVLRRYGISRKERREA
jgi:hypothetical protein